MEKASTSIRSRSRRPAADLAAALLDAAAVEFAAHGFEGASTRRIAERAGAHQPQINYHFASKEQLWRATVDRLFALLVVPDVAAAPDPASAFAAGVERFLQVSASHPALNRIVNQEATAPSSRLDWLVATHLRPLHRLVAAAWADVRASGAGADLPADEVWELVTTYGALRFANAPMLALLEIPSGTEPADAAEHARRVLSVLGLAPAPGSRPGRR
ncbi:MAG: TetR family transcriptional regulator [Actinobacteria bacterium]|nr:TetR family transcriptional regulator [Actinomycetota bacterium]